MQEIITNITNFINYYNTSVQGIILYPNCVQIIFPDSAWQHDTTLFEVEGGAHCNYKLKVQGMMIPTYLRTSGNKKEILDVVLYLIKSIWEADRRVWFVNQGNKITICSQNTPFYGEIEIVKEMAPVAIIYGTKEDVIEWQRATYINHETTYSLIEQESIGADQYKSILIKED